MRLTKCDFERIQQNEIEKEIRRNEPGRENYSFDENIFKLVIFYELKKSV